MMPQLINYFPQGLASGKNFCNRVAEKKRLTLNVQTARATLIMSPRRYGKTSLVLEVLHRMKIPFSCIDLYSDLNEEDVQNAILSAVADMLYQFESTPAKALKVVTDFFAGINVSLRMVGAEVRIEVSREKNSAAKNILAALKKLDNVLKSRKKQVCLFFDEFQRMTQIMQTATIEGAIRTIAQQSKNISFVFSGSNRHLLGRMFDDRSKPLYKLCDRIIIDRISEKHYMPFINARSRQRWDNELSDEALEAVFELTERHPYYVNVLCHRAWLSDKPPTEIKIRTLWNQYASEEKTNILNELELLGGNQMKMLMALAKHGDTVSPMSGEFIALTRFSLSSASQTIKLLEKKDYLSINKDQKYQLIDPLIKYIFFQSLNA